jgi:hypothetical protein
MAASIELIERIAEVFAADVADDGNAQRDGFRVAWLRTECSSSEDWRNRA